MCCSAFSLRNSTVSPPLLLFFALLCSSLDFLFCVFPYVSIAVLCISSAFTLSPSILSLFLPSSRSCSSADSSMAIICSIASCYSVFVGLIPLSFHFLASFPLIFAPKPGYGLKLSGYPEKKRGSLMLFRVSAILCHKALHRTDFFFALNGFTKIISRPRLQEN